eukprot:TRINITY_DN105328_c0_g1_i1.p1 TRINITY_DN105328_c0_g1~~TRINITY_DN105328_c0_g1_i1.p1  ORF type:complete len:407 (+),score=42.28 TRINITY_DN105328_c0_g1_i1:35-1255(+)
MRGSTRAAIFLTGVGVGITLTILFNVVLGGAAQCECPNCIEPTMGNTEKLENEVKKTDTASATECAPCPQGEQPKEAACPPCTKGTSDSSQLRVVQRASTGVGQNENFIGVVQPVLSLTSNAKLSFPPGIKRLAVDVGTSLYSPSSSRWFADHPEDLFVLAFEPNKFSHSLVAYTSHPIMALNPTKWVMFTTECRTFENHRIGNTFEEYYKHCMNTTYKHLIDHRHQFGIVNAAVSNRTGFATFNLGVGDAGTGSLYEFKKNTKWASKDNLQKFSWGHANVPVVRLDDFLPYVPEGIIFETLKIDAQGHDAEVVLGSGAFLEKFKCVVGEFQTDNYANADGKGFDHFSLLKKTGFIFLGKTRSANPRGPGLWMNTRFKEQFLAGEHMCTASDFAPHKSEIKWAFSK